ncbi:MAG TPA: preprotein translocase subunit SecG [Candidatus Cloacimonadota bacterium]|nr:preprotein translocase subunit SecG [Candidatus Cloacimonadota bacterium]HOV16869.1 preprotein translocase subunit SecG [Candidatus Cloacimonadota bacterium]HQL14528.1 preprotein translocase subunit SecG [Candidatus Cloacimonadota bacterium]
MVLYTVLLILHVIICVALVLVILAQTSKGGLDPTLGGAAVNVFGGSGASNFLKKWTQYLGAAFLVSCLLLAFVVKNMKTTNKTTELQKRINTEAPLKK